MISPIYMYSIPYYIIQEIINLFAVCLVDFLTPPAKFAFPYLMLTILPSVCLFHDSQLYWYCCPHCMTLPTNTCINII